MSDYKSNNKINLIKTDIEQTTEIMKQNIEKVLERDQKLGNIESQTEELQQGAHRFHKISKKLKYSMWCKNLKFTLIIVFAIILLLIIILSIILKK